MSVIEGTLLAVFAFAVTAVFISAAGLAVMVLRIDEERRGTGRSAARSRRSRCGHGCRTPMAEPVGVKTSNQEK